MKVLKYNLCTIVNHGTENHPIIEKVLSPVTMPYNEINELIAQSESYDGYYVEDDGIEVIEEPTQLDRIEAQVTYTAMITDTLLEV